MNTEQERPIVGATPKGEILREGDSVCDNCGNQEHSAVELAVCIGSFTPVAPMSGLDRCYCGCKYWENGCCVDCGEQFGS